MVTGANAAGAQPGNDRCMGTSEVHGGAKATRAGATSAGAKQAACTKILTDLTPHQRRIDQTLAQRKCVAAAVKVRFQSGLHTNATVMVYLRACTCFLSQGCMSTRPHQVSGET